MALGETHFATDDGSFGAHGNVGRLLSEALAKDGSLMQFMLVVRMVC